MSKKVLASTIMVGGLILLLNKKRLVSNQKSIGKQILKSRKTSTGFISRSNLYEVYNNSLVSKNQKESVKLYADLSAKDKILVDSQIKNIEYAVQQGNVEAVNKDISEILKTNFDVNYLQKIKTAKDREQFVKILQPVFHETNNYPLMLVNYMTYLTYPKYHLRSSNTFTKEDVLGVLNNVEKATMQDKEVNRSLINNYQAYFNILECILKEHSEIVTNKRA